MAHDHPNRMCCAVCGIETKRHTGWFLVVDNHWLDRIKILSWHPVLASTGKMRAVCGTAHLKLLLTHWLNCSNLQLVASGYAPMPTVLDSGRGGPGYPNLSLGRVLGELAVERDWLSPAWTGSPEAMECILDTLVGETESRSKLLEPTFMERLVGYSRDYAFR
jgi:hypothetical protein